jgi:hypothetical protein
MKMTKNTQDNKFQSSVGRMLSIEDLEAWNTTIIKILLLAKGKRVCLVTISPQSYSIGIDLSKYQAIKRNKFEYLLSWDIVFLGDFLHKIAESEEFKRGLLFIVLSESVMSVFETIDAINSSGTIDLKQLLVEIIFMEDDGETLTWNCPSEETKFLLSSI